MSTKTADLQFAGGAFHPSLPRGRSSGAIMLQRDGIHFESEHQKVTFPRVSLQIKRGGAGNRLWMLSHPQYPEWTIYASGSEFAKSLEQYPDLRPYLLKQKQQRHLKIGLFLLAFLLLGLSFSHLLSSRHLLSSWVAKQIPPEWEVKLGKTVFDQMQGQFDLIEDPSIGQDIQEFVTPLLEALGQTPYVFEFHIANESIPNAFALPGGVIVIHSGLILKADTPEEVLGVLAHEISHVTCRHSTRQLVETAGLYLVVQALLGDFTGLVTIAADNGLLLLTRSFSRAHETEADQEGLRLMKKADVNPEGLITFFEKMMALEKEKSKQLKDSSSSENLDQVLDFLSTHPATEDRIEHLRKMIQAENFPEQHTQINFDFESFQDKIRQQIAGDL